MESLFFWIGLAALIGVALVLRHFATDKRKASPPEPTAGRVVRRFRQGRVRLAVWLDPTRAGSVAGHHISVDRRGPDCADCMECANRALRWIQAQEEEAKA